MSEVLAIKYDVQESEAPAQKKKIVAVPIPQFQDNLGMKAGQWAQLYVGRMETDVQTGRRCPDESRFLFEKIKAQYPEIKSALWSA